MWIDSICSLSFSVGILTHYIYMYIYILVLWITDTMWMLGPRPHKSENPVKQYDFGCVNPWARTNPGCLGTQVGFGSLRPGPHKCDCRRGRV